MLINIYSRKHVSWSLLSIGGQGSAVSLAGLPGFDHAGALRYCHAPSRLTAYREKSWKSSGMPKHAAGELGQLAALKGFNHVYAGQTLPINWTLLWPHFHNAAVVQRGKVRHDRGRRSHHRGRVASETTNGKKKSK